MPRRTRGSARPPSSASSVDAEHGREDQLDLEHRERHPEAAPDAAAEGQPRVGIGLLADEALGLEALGLRVALRAAVREVDRRAQERPGGHAVGADVERHGRAASHEREDRPLAQRLAHHAVEVRQLVDRREVELAIARDRRELRAQPREDLGMHEHALERPRERGGRRLVACDHERHQLVA